MKELLDQYHGDGSSLIKTGHLQNKDVMKLEKAFISAGLYTPPKKTREIEEIPNEKEKAISRFNALRKLLRV